MKYHSFHFFDSKIWRKIKVAVVLNYFRLISVGKKLYNVMVILI